MILISQAQVDASPRDALALSWAEFSRTIPLREAQVTNINDVDPCKNASPADFSQTN